MGNLLLDYYIYMYIYIYTRHFSKRASFRIPEACIQVRGKMGTAHQEITNELLPSLVVDHPTGFAPLDALVAAVTGLTGRHRGEIYGVQKELEKVRISSGKMM